MANESLDPIGPIGYFPECLVSSQDGYFYGVAVLADLLVRIDPESGAGTAVGTMGVFSGWEGRPDLTEDAAGQLWMIVDGGVYRVDKATGASTLQCQVITTVVGITSQGGDKITSTGFPDPQDPGCSLQYGGPASNWLTVGPDGWIYGMTYPFITAAATTILRADPTTGEVEQVALVWGFDLMGIAWRPEGPEQTEQIPALDGRGVVVMVVLFAVAGIAILRK